MPTTDGREIVLTRYTTQPEKDLLLLLQQLKISLPEQAPPENPLPANPLKSDAAVVPTFDVDIAK